jgi:hypothetical protein
MNRHFAQTLFIGSIALALPLGANAADTSVSSALTPGASTAAGQANPIRITDIQVTKAWHTEDKFTQPRMVTITFANQNALPATEIVFDLRDSGGRIINQYRDAGKYAQGKSITHGFFDVHVPRRFQMDAAKVTFEDGSVWTASEEAAPVRRQATENDVTGDE